VPRALSTLILAVAIPAAAILVISMAEARLESLWRADLIQQYGPQRDDVLERVRLSRICSVADIAAQLREACQTIGIAELMKPITVAAVAISTLALAGLVPLRRIAGRGRRILVWFRPFLMILLLVLAVLVILDGVLVAAAAYVGESVFLNTVHPYVMFAIGLAVLVAFVGVIRAALTMSRIRPVVVNGLTLDRARDPRLFDFVDDIALNVGASAPDHIVAGLDPTFFVTETPVAGIEPGRTLFLSVPFIRILTRSELRAVIGHELGHFRGEDTAYSRRFYPIYRGSIESLGILQASARGWSGIPLLPPLQILALFFSSFVEAERSLSRDRELAADAVGAEAASPLDLASTLIKLEAFGPKWNDAVVEARDAFRASGIPGNPSERFSELARGDANPDALKAVDRGVIIHPTDSHPRTSERIRALGVDQEAAIQRALNLSPTDSGFALIDAGESLEADLADDFAEQLNEDEGLIGAAEAEIDQSSSLRRAGRENPAINALVRLIEPLWGPDLQQPIVETAAWVCLADLELGGDTETGTFRWLVPLEDIPTGDRRLLLGMATPRTPADQIVQAGTRLRLIGVSTWARRRVGKTELLFELDGAAIVARLVGVWPVEQQIAGIFVVPETQPLANRDSHFHADLARVIEQLRQHPPSLAAPPPTEGSAG
jgi:Zn-dependent protease with chaperone function